MYILKLLNHDNSNKPALSHPQGLTLFYIPTPPPHFTHTAVAHMYLPHEVRRFTMLNEANGVRK